jgi:ubiquinone biosynthesis protein
MHEQVGWKGAWERIQVEAPQWAKMLPDFPRLAHQFLERRALVDNSQQERLLTALIAEQRRTNRLVGTALLLVGGFVAGVVLTELLGWVGYW